MTNKERFIELYTTHIKREGADKSVIDSKTEELKQATKETDKFLKDEASSVGKLEKELSALEKQLKDEKDEEIYKQIINIVNEYSFIDDYNDVKEYILNDISKIKTKKNKLKNMVRIIDIENDLLTDDYVILMNFNEGVIPTNHKNEDYLNDEIKEFCGCWKYNK